MDVLAYPRHSALPNAAQPQHYPYDSSVSSTAPSSASSIFSVDFASSQCSVSSAASSVDASWEPTCQPGGLALASAAAEATSSQCPRNGKFGGFCKSTAEAAVPAELRQNPRRTRNVCSNGSTSGAPARPPPQLVRQSDRKESFVDRLVDSAAQIVETVWPLSMVASKGDSVGCKTILPLRVFIQETLRRSRTSYSTLQVALYYLILIKNCVPQTDFTMEQPRSPSCPRAMQCGRRMFLAALILASKYLQDRNYSTRAWSKISGLSIAEINQNEWAFLEAVDWKLHIAEPVFQRWNDIVMMYTPNSSDFPNGEISRWADIIPLLTPELDLDCLLKHIPRSSSAGSDMFMPPSCSEASSPRSTPVPGRTPAHITSCPVDFQAPTDLRPNLPAPFEPNLQNSQDLPAVQLPSIPKLGLLPTPQMTPQSNAACTPAVSAGGVSLNSRPPSSSIGAALQQANSVSVQRTAVEQRPPPMYNSRQNSFESYSQCRRSSLARSCSLSSSPESMVSDVPSLSSSQSSRSSRSSSISSVASGVSAPVQPRLAGRSMRRFQCSQMKGLKDHRKNLTIATPIEEANCSDFCASPESLSDVSSIPDFANFNLGTPAGMSASAAAREAAQGLCELSSRPDCANPCFQAPSYPSPKAPGSKSCGSRWRKRCRTGSTDDSSLQENVRHLVNSSGQRNGDDGTVVPDGQVADSFLLSQSKKARNSAFSSLKLPLPTQSSGIKRACCEEDAAKYLRGLQRGVPAGDAVNVAD